MITHSASNIKSQFASQRKMLTTSSLSPRKNKNVAQNMFQQLTFRTFMCYFIKGFHIHTFPKSIHPQKTYAYVAQQVAHSLGKI